MKKRMPSPTVEFKNQILKRCFVNGESVSSVAKETGYSSGTIYMWRHDFIKNSLPIDIEKMNNGETRTSKIERRKSENQILERCFVNGEEVSKVAKEIGRTPLERDFIKRSLPENEIASVLDDNQVDANYSLNVQIADSRLIYFVISADGKRYNWDEVRKALRLYETLRRTYEQS